ncbi:hypothetical protein E4U55_005922 [Claviceps digitariae]|nr:hypothetical protein E4U55_005922 [Claviceps digitariae]
MPLIIPRNNYKYVEEASLRENVISGFGRESIDYKYDESVAAGAIAIGYATWLDDDEVLCLMAAAQYAQFCTG